MLTYIAGFAWGAVNGFLLGGMVGVAWWTWRLSETQGEAAAEPREDVVLDRLQPWHEEWRRHTADN